MFRVASERKRLAAVPAGVSEDVDEAEVVTSGDQHAVVGARDSVDVSAVASLREDAIDAPSELRVLGGPSDALGVGLSVLVLSETALRSGPV